MREPTKQDRERYRIRRKGNARRRDRDGNPILYKLTFDEWWQIWQDSGHYDEMGTRKGQYVMSRVEDRGHYEVGNVFIQTAEQNHRDAMKWFKGNNTPEVIAKRVASRLKNAKPSPQRGKNLPKAQCQKISDTMTGKPQPWLRKLSDDDITRIRAMGGTCRQKDIADLFGVTQSLISQVLLHKGRYA